MDAFFTSVEQVDNPELRGKPIVIGQSLRGVAAAASYEARKFGVHSAMPIAQAKRLCPQAIFLPGRMKRYKEVSNTIMAIIRTCCPVVEQASVDEAYADVTGMERISGSAKCLAQDIKSEILSNTKLTCSIGIAPNKFLAKIASDWKKPDGLTCIHLEDVATFLHDLPLAKIPGVGTRMIDELRRMGVVTIPDVLARPRQFWVTHLGKRGAFLHDRARGVDHSAVETHLEPQSCSAENTLDTDTTDRDLLVRWLLSQAERVGRNLRLARKRGHTVTLKLKFDDFSTLTRSTTLRQATDVTADIFQAARRLLINEKLPRPVRLIGTGISGFHPSQVELPLGQDAHRQREQRVDQAMDRIRDKFGSRSILRADVAARDSEGIQDLLSKKNSNFDQE